MSSCIIRLGVIGIYVPSVATYLVHAFANRSIVFSIISRTQVHCIQHAIYRFVGTNDLDFHWRSTSVELIVAVCDRRNVLGRRSASCEVHRDHKRCLTRFLIDSPYPIMSIEVGEGFGIVGNQGVEVEGLGVGEVGVGDGNGNSGPVGAEPTAEAVGVVAGAEVIVAGFGVAFLAFELVSVLGARVRDGALATVGIEVGVVANDAGVGGGNAGSAQKIFDIVDRSAGGGERGNALAAEEDVFGGGVAGGVGFGEDVAAGAVPV